MADHHPGIRAHSWRARSSLERDSDDHCSDTYDEANGGAPRGEPPTPAAPMCAIHRIVERVAPSTISVLLLGETGVGKEVMAERLHRASARAHGPLVRVNCAAFSESLLESELFGHERGAFTGAAHAKPGLLEAAHGGTLLLDEIGELPLPLQAKLLRVVESLELFRVGAVKPHQIDVRFISATNRDLDGAMQSGRFRPDLFYRLNGVTIAIPPLRQRVAEIASLATTFIAAAAERARLPAVPRLSAAARRRLERHSWPGNIRELRNMMERAVLLCNSGSITVEHLAIEDNARARADEPSPMNRAATMSGPAASEHERILAALTACGGNQSRAAALLGMSRNTLLARLDAYGLPRPRKQALHGSAHARSRERGAAAAARRAQQKVKPPSL